MWPTLWTCFASGPDWYYEKDEAVQLTRCWRCHINSQKRISYRPIIEVLCDAKYPCFFAFGRHTANDFLHSIGIFPGAPAAYICRSDTRFNNFLAGIQAYMQQWAGCNFLNHVSSICNSQNSFAYNYTSFHFYRAFLLVFRRAYVTIPQNLYNTMMNQGLFNPEHRIGAFLMEYLFSKLTVLQAINIRSKPMTTYVPGSHAGLKFTLTLT